MLRCLIMIVLFACVPAWAAPLTNLAGRPRVDGVAMSSPQTQGRVLELQTDSGQTLRVTAYGDGIVRVQAVGPGQAFFADNRYEMVEPRNHQAMTGRFLVQDPDLNRPLLLTLQAQAGQPPV